jgi:hypothetical protein
MSWLTGTSRELWSLWRTQPRNLNSTYCQMNSREGLRHKTKKT